MVVFVVVKVVEIVVIYVVIVIIEIIVNYYEIIIIVMIVIGIGIFVSICIVKATFFVFFAISCYYLYVWEAKVIAGVIVLFGAFDIEASEDVVIFIAI